MDRCHIDAIKGPWRMKKPRLFSWKWGESNTYPSAEVLYPAPTESGTLAPSTGRTTLPHEEVLSAASFASHRLHGTQPMLQYGHFRVIVRYPLSATVSSCVLLDPLRLCQCPRIGAQRPSPVPSCIRRPPQALGRIGRSCISTTWSR